MADRRLATLNHASAAALFMPISAMKTTTAITGYLQLVASATIQPRSVLHPVSYSELQNPIRAAAREPAQRDRVAVGRRLAGARHRDAVKARRGRHVLQPLGIAGARRPFLAAAPGRDHAPGRRRGAR